MGVVNVSRPMSGSSAEDLSQLCHDLRQYVAAGLLLSETSSAAIDDGAVLGRMSLIHQQFTAIAELLDVEPDAGHQIGGVNLTQLAGECADVVRLTHRVSVICERSTLVVAAGDQVLLRRAIGNLLDNACRAAGGAGTVQVHVGAADGEAFIEVSDDGPGFGDVASGTGHGLNVVAQAVRACAGRLELHSAPGAGTTVRLCMPAGPRSVRSA
jgi:signal transduction histidine kinase